jgi:hypothetical protein
MSTLGVAWLQSVLGVVARLQLPTIFVSDPVGTHLLLALII